MGAKLAVCYTPQSPMAGGDGNSYINDSSRNGSLSSRNHPRANCGHVCRSDRLGTSPCCWCRAHHHSSGDTTSIETLKVVSKSKRESLCSLCLCRQKTIVNVIDHVEEAQRVSEIAKQASRPTTPTVAENNKSATATVA